MSDTEEIKSRLPIEQVIGSYVPLKKAGRIFKACCPFHNEKTPSFTVSPDRGIFKCFGCNEGGDIFDFVMKIEGLTFPETITLLAERAGVTLQDFQTNKGKPANPKEVSKNRLLAVNSYVAKLWHTVLSKHPKAQPARDYLAKRGLKEETISNFQIGYAPLGNGTAVGLEKAGFTSQEVEQAGGPNKFQDRITFPIADLTGKIIGFTGRLLETPEDPAGQRKVGPKYWNTPETSLFIKSKALYALHLAKQAIQQEDCVILAEGQMDVVMLHQANYRNTVASSGTALTAEQVRLLGRFTENIIFAYDGDAAGIQATKRGAELVLQAELNPYVISIPHGKDPADCLKQAPELWKEAYANRQPFLEWLISHHAATVAELTPVRKKEIAKEILPWIAQLRDPIEQGEWIRILAATLQTEESNLLAALERLKTKSPSRPTPTEQATINQPNPSSSQPVTSPLLKRAELGLAILLTFPEIFPGVRSQIGDLSLAGNSPFLSLLLPVVSNLPAGTELREQIKEQFTEAEQKAIGLQIEELLAPYQELEMDSVWALSELMLILQRIRSDAKEEAKSKLAGQIRHAQQTKNPEQLKQLFSELKKLL